MVRQDRFLTGILIGIGVLVVAAVVLFYLRQSEVGYSGGTRPEDVVHDYALAVQQGDYNQAYTYLAEVETRPTVEDFRQIMGSMRGEYSRAAVEIGTARLEGQDAVVDITILRTGTDLFADTYRDEQTAQLIQEGGQWKIVQMAYPYWSFEWSPLNAKPVGR